MFWTTIKILIPICVGILFVTFLTAYLKAWSEVET